MCITLWYISRVYFALGGGAEINLGISVIITYGRCNVSSQGKSKVVKTDTSAKWQPPKPFKSSQYFTACSPK